MISDESIVCVPPIIYTYRPHIKYIPIICDEDEKNIPATNRVPFFR